MKDTFEKIPSVFLQCMSPPVCVDHMELLGHSACYHFKKNKFLTQITSVLMFCSPNKDD